LLQPQQQSTSQQGSRQLLLRKQQLYCEQLQQVQSQQLQQVQSQQRQQQGALAHQHDARTSATFSATMMQHRHKQLQRQQQQLLQRQQQQQLLQRQQQPVGVGSRASKPPGAAGNELVTGVYARYDARRRFEQHRQAFDMLNQMKSDKIAQLESRLAQCRLTEAGGSAAPYRQW
jgi:hypothetical protein